MGWIGRAIVLEHVRFEPLERDGAQKARGHDAIRVDVVASQRKTSATDMADG
jgi:hypothetical protein